MLEKLFGTDFPKKKPAWLRSGRKSRLELDGYSERSGIAFEYQGIQHFVKNKHFHSGNVAFRQRLADDKLKAKLCKERGVILLQIPYTIPHSDFENYIRGLLKREGKGRNGKAILNRLGNGGIDLAELNAYSPQNLLEMQQLANRRGGKCLSKFYINSTTKLRWRCKFGHVWESPPASIRAGSWCHKCVGYRQHTLAEMKAIARKRGGRCLATKYLGYKTKILWECARGHSWNTTPGRVISGAWCPYCANRPPITIEDVQAAVKRRGGKCLSTKYVNAHKKLRIRCPEGHEWKLNWNNLQSGNWCPVCARKKTGERRRLTIVEMRKLARNRGGVCLSEEYKNCETKLLWQCKHGHLWQAKPSHVKRGSWCPVCAGRRARQKDLQMSNSKRTL
jgi:hypothetical protein